MLSRCIRTVSNGKADMPLARFLTSAIRPRSVRLLHMQPWLARSSALVSASLQFEEDRPPSLDDIKWKQLALARSEVFTQTSLEQELRYLRDPRKLADYTLNLLQKDQEQKAYELVKMSSKSLPCTVSWNHLINFEMSQGRVANACKIYNDMKKRAQQPDAQTYTLLFRGLAMFPQYPQSLARALSIYQSMYADNCPVKPSIVHHNAVIKVCARCNDIDALLGIAAKLPTHGAGAADNRTFTTVLNALRTDAWQSLHDDTPQGKAERRHRASMQARRIWGEIIKRWEKGDIKIDEELVCSMGRILLIADSERTCRDILSLVTQTMGIQQPKSLIKMSPRDLRELDGREGGSPKSDHEMGRSPSPNEPVSDSDEVPDNVPGSEFFPLSKINSKQPPFAQAGCNTLSLVIDTCIRLRAIPAAQDYWGLLTDPDGPHNINPDSDNYHMFLRLLRIQRASRLALEIVRAMRSGRLGSEPIKLEPKTFRIALSACVRDIKNPNVLEHAAALVKMMLDTLMSPDIKSLELYLYVALSSEHSNDWRSLMSVLRGSVLGVRSLRNQMNYSKEKRTPSDEEDLVRLMRRLIGGFDIILRKGDGFMDRRDVRACTEQRDTLMSWVTRSKVPGAKVPGPKLKREKHRRDQMREHAQSFLTRTSLTQAIDGVDEDPWLAEDVNTESNTGVETDDRSSFGQKTRQLTQLKIRHKPIRKLTFEGGARDRMRRMAHLDEEYAG